ncbi:MFS transporter [Bosea sp. 2KB_26]|uniref:MFS transporter n=1 Tax=Bosea sp. 2KB_26 TaxID=3237475 RepID=UPI003F8F447A
MQGTKDGQMSTHLPAATITGPQTVLFATAVGIIVTNLFAPQTLVGLIGPSFGVDAAGFGLVAMATLLGYAAGLFFLVPLADLAENRALILRMLIAAAMAAGIATLAPTANALLIVLFVLGAACSAIQILVPIAASMAPPGQDGRVIGDVMSGLMVGILLARPLASLVADAWGWRAFYGLSAASLILLACVLAVSLPRRLPAARTSYGALIASLLGLLRDEPMLRRRALTAALVMAAFSLFWTAVALRLAQSPFDLGQRGIALFALAGAGGAAVTPLFGRAGDRGWTRSATIACHLVLIGAMALSAWAGSAVAATGWVPIALMGVSAVLLDIGVTGDQTLGRRAINLLQPKARGRLNGLFVGIFFIGGATGSMLAGIAWAWNGWPAVCSVGAAFGLAALLVDWIGGPE